MSPHVTDLAAHGAGLATTRLMLDGRGGQLTLDGLSVIASADLVGPSGGELDVLPVETTALPAPVDDFWLGDKAFMLQVLDSSTGTQVAQLSSPLRMEYGLTLADLNLAAGDPGRLKLARWSDGAWLAMPCEAAANELDCSVPYPGLVAVVVSPPPSDSLDGALSTGWFYKQANGFDGAGEVGFSVVDDSDAGMWTAFQRFGGVERLGYPISGRFEYGGMVTQVFQKAALQWAPDLGRAVPVNIFDDLSAHGSDAWLDAARQVPPAGAGIPAAANADDDVVSRQIGLLEAYPALRDFYSADPDAMTLYGLPVSIQTYDSLVTVRLERGALRLWTADMRWAAAGTVVSVNAGELAREAGLWPPNAMVAATMPHATADDDPAAAGQN